MELQDRTLRRRSVVLSASFVLSGLLAYVLMAVAKRSMSPIGFSNFAVYWSFGYFLAATVGAPIEQELTRTVSFREAKRQSFDDDLQTAVKLAALLVGAVVVVGVAVAASGELGGLHADVFTCVVMILFIGGEVAGTVVRGVLAGTRSTMALAGLVAGQGVLRTGLVIIAVGVSARDELVWLAVSVAALTCVAFIPRALATRTPGRGAPDGPGLARGGIMRLVAAAPFSAVFSVGTPALASLVATPGDRPIIGDLMAALSLTSAPVLVAAALQSALMPSLVRSLVEGGPDVLHRTTRVIIMVVIGLSGFAAAGSAVFGLTFLRLLFGPTPGVGRVALVAMTFASGLLFLGNLLAPVCIALRSHGAVTRAWAAGAATMVGIVFLPGPIAQRVAGALLGGAFMVSASLVVSLRAAWRRPSGMGHAALGHSSFDD